MTLFRCMQNVGSGPRQPGRPGCREGEIRTGLGSSRSPRPSGRGIVGNDVNNWPNWPIGRLFGSFELATFVLRFQIAAFGSGNVAGDTYLSGGENAVLPWLSCTVSSSRIAPERETERLLKKPLHIPNDNASGPVWETGKKVVFRPMFRRLSATCPGPLANY